VIDWLTIDRGSAPLIVSVPHAGTHIPDDIASGLASASHARAMPTSMSTGSMASPALGATIVRTAISRTVIDVNRDPSRRLALSGTGDHGSLPDRDVRRRAALSRGPHARLLAEIARRRETYFDPYHAALRNRDRAAARRASARRALRCAFDPQHRAAPVRRRTALVQHRHQWRRTCDPALTERSKPICDASGLGRVNGRFKGGWITRHYGGPRTASTRSRWSSRCAPISTSAAGLADAVERRPCGDAAPCRIILRSECSTHASSLPGNDHDPYRQQPFDHRAARHGADAPPG
jgi:N-formylglutamate deformylase